MKKVLFLLLVFVVVINSQAAKKKKSQKQKQEKQKQDDDVDELSLDDFEQFDMDHGVPDYNGKVKNTQKDDDFLEFNDAFNATEDNSGDQDQDIFAENSFNNIQEQQQEQQQQMLQRMKEAIENNNDNELKELERKQNQDTSDNSQKQNIKKLKAYGAQSDQEFYGKVNRGIYQDFFGEEAHKAEATIHLARGESFKFYKQVKETPDILKIMVGYYSSFNHYPDTRTKYVQMTVTPPEDLIDDNINDNDMKYNKIRNPIKKEVNYNLNQLNTVITYHSFHKGEHCFSLLNSTPEPVILHLVVVSLKNDLHYVDRNIQQQEKKERTQQNVDVIQRQDKDLVSLKGDRLHAKECTTHLREVSNSLMKITQLEDQEYYRHEITLRKVSTTAKFYKDIIILETVIIILLGFFQVKFIASQITTKVLL